MKQRMVSLSLVLLLLLGMLPVQVSAVTAKLPADQAAAYAEELQRIIGLYGIGGGNAQEEPGLYYAQLLDLNADGVQELFYIYAPGTDGNRIANFAAYSFQGGQLRQWFDERHLYAVGSRDNKSLHLGQGESGACYLRIAGDSSNGAQSNEYGTILALDDGVQEVASYSIDLYYETMGYDESTPIYLDKELVIDGETVLDTHTRTDVFGAISDIPFSEWEVYRPRYGLDSSTWLADVVMGTLHIEKSDVETMLANLQTAANAGLTAADLLARLPYVGDISQCKMTPAQAKAFADVLESEAQEAARLTSDRAHTICLSALFDAGGGIPALWVIYAQSFGDTYDIYDDQNDYQGSSLWEWDGQKAVKSSFPQNFIERGLVQSGTNAYLFGNHESISVDSPNFHARYPLKEGHISKTASESFLVIPYANYLYSDVSDLPLGDDLKNYLLGYMGLGELQSLCLDYATVKLDDWIKDQYDTWRLRFVNGKKTDLETLLRVSEQMNDPAPQLGFGGYVGLNLVGSWAQSSSVATTLRAFADSGPSYTFPAVTDDEALVRAIAQAVADKLGGEITGIYQLADGLWYVVITVDGTAKGAVVQAVQSGGKLTYEVLDSHDTPAEEAVLQGLANDFQSTPNLSPDYAATEDFTTTKDFLDYLNGLLDYIPGGTPNDAAKGELAAFLENSISRVSTVTVTAQGNRVTLTGGDISAGCTSAKDAADKLLGALTAADVTLNKTLTIIIRIQCQGLDSGKPLQLDLDKSLLDTLGDAELMLLLGDSSRAVRITAANLRMLIDAYETLSIQIEKTGNSYTINFLNAKGEIITRLCANVSFLLPATGPLATVLASYEGGSDNWGGQYDERAAAILFSTPYSGTYEVMENDLTISDLEGLSEEQRTAISFMVSKGYFTLDGTDAFRPTEFLTRYDFTKALVGMFFAMEHGLSTTFADVPADSPYFDAVASAQAKDIVKGYNETTFAGEANISGEQVLTLAGRTLVERKGYSYPADPAGYLTFPGGAEVDNWAKEATSLAAREGILAPGESLAPLADLSRADAALYLYRLFMLLYETSPEAIQMQAPPEKPAAPSTPILPIVLVAGGLAAAGGGGAWLWLKRKKGG